MKQRMNEILIGIGVIMFAAFVAFNYSELPNDPGITGYAINTELHAQNVQYEGMQFNLITKEAGGGEKTTIYLYTGEYWVKSDGGLDWEVIEEWDSFWSALTILDQMGTLTLPNGYIINDVVEFAKVYGPLI